MRLRVFTSIVRKELLETVRDRRTLFAILLLPAIVYPLLFVVMGALATADVARVERQTATVGLWGPVPAVVEEAIRDVEVPAIQTRRVEGPPPGAEAARRSIESDEVHVVVVAAPGADAVLAGGGTAEIRVVFSQVKPLSRRAGGEVEAALQRLGDELLRERVTRLDLPPDFAVPLEVTETDVATEEQRGGDFLGRIIPLLLLMMVTVGASHPAVDLTAGEKERGTMQTLLVSPVRAVEIIAGKYVVVVLVAVASAIVNLGAILVALGRMTLGGPGSPAPAPSVGHVAGVLLVLVPTACLLAAVLMAVAVFARSFREGQTYVAPVMVVAMTAGFVATSDMDLTPQMAFAPLLNVVMVMRDMFRGQLVASTAYLVFLSTALYSVAAVIGTARLFENEQVLLSGERPWRDIRFRRLGRSVPSGRSALLFAVVLLVAVYYASLFAPRLGFTGAVLFTQVGLLAGGAVLWVLVGRHSFRETLYLRLPTARGAVGTLLVAAGGWSLSSVAARAATLVFPAAADFYRSLGEAIGAGTGELSLAAAVGLLALAPAMSEELAFRGVVLSGLRSTGTAAGAVIGSAVLFGAFHLSVFHAVPAAAAGVVLALVVWWSGSLVGAVAVHAVNNTIAVLAVRRPDLVESLDSPQAIAAGLLLLAVGLAVTRGSRTEG